MTDKGKTNDKPDSRLGELHEVIGRDPGDRFRAVMEKYKDSRSRFRQHVSERSVRLDAVGSKHQNAEQREQLRANTNDPCGTSAPRVIFTADPCSSDFDATELSLRPNRGKWAQDFYKVLIFNHPAGVGFYRNGWYLGHIQRFRQEWRPGGFSIGELVHSTSLAPLEKTVLEISDWEKSRTEIEEMEESDEKREQARSSQSTDSSEISSASSSNFDWYVDAQAEAAWGWGSASIEGGASGGSEQSASTTRSSINEQCSSSANSISEKRTVKVSMSKESGSEQRTVRELQNTNRCHSLTLNIFQLKKLYDVVVTYLDSPLCLIMPYAKNNLTDPDIFAMCENLNEGLRDVRSPFNVVTHYMTPNARVAKYLDMRSSHQESVAAYGDDVALAPFGDGVMVLEFTTHDPAAIREGLIYFFGLVWDHLWDSNVDVPVFDAMIEQYMLAEANIRNAEMEAGEQIIDTIEILTRGLYMDSMLGKCSACEDFITVSRSNEALKDYATARELELTNALLETEIARRQALLDSGVYDAFEPPPIQTDEDDEQ